MVTFVSLIPRCDSGNRDLGPRNFLVLRKLFRFCRLWLNETEWRNTGNHKPSNKLAGDPDWQLFYPFRALAVGLRSTLTICGMRELADWTKKWRCTNTKWLHTWKAEILRHILYGTSVNFSNKNSDEINWWNFCFLWRIQNFDEMKQSLENFHKEKSRLKWIKTYNKLHNLTLFPDMCVAGSLLLLIKKGGKKTTNFSFYK